MRLLRLVPLLVLTLVVSAQEEPAAITTGDPAVPVKELELRLVPMARGPIETGATAWRERAQATSRELECSPRKLRSWSGWTRC